MATIDTSQGTIDIAGADDLLLDSPNWVFDGAGRLVEGSRVRGAVGSAVRRLGAVTTRRSARSGALHLLATPIRAHGRVVTVAVTGVDETPYAVTLASITGDAVLLGILAVLGATGLAALVLGRSLGPVDAMTERAAEWSRHPQRLALRPRPAARRAHRARSGARRVARPGGGGARGGAEAHRGVRARAALPADAPDWRGRSGAHEAVDGGLRARALPAHRVADDAMARATTTLLSDAAAASEGNPDTVVLEAVSAVVATMYRSIDVLASGPADRVAVRFVHLERMLAPVLDNAVRMATKRVTVEVVPADGQVAVVTTDDGPRIDPAVATTLFETGVATRPTGTVLGLALARRLVVEAGGDLRVVSTTPAAFALLLPRALDPAALR